MRVPWPFGHLGLKAVSIGLAFALWMAVAGQETVERGLRVPLELQQFPSGLEVQGEPPTLVDVRVRGTSGALARVSPGDIVAVLDLHGARPGRRLFQLTPEQVRTPFGVEVIQVTPTSIAIEFENGSARRVPVVPSVEGEPAPGFTVGAIVADPAEVEITGPESAVAAATEALTESISIAGASGPVHEVVSVGVLNPTLRVKSARTVAVQVQIVPGPRERTMHEQPIHLRSMAESLRARAVPPAVTVQIRGSREAVGKVTAADVVAFVDLGGLGPGDYTLPVRIDAPGGAGVMGIDPATVQVSIANEKH